MQVEVASGDVASGGLQVEGCKWRDAKQVESLQVEGCKRLQVEGCKR